MMTIVDKSLAESYLKEHNEGNAEEDTFFTPPCSPTGESLVSKKKKLLEEFLKENAARSIASIPCQEMPIRAR